MVTCRQAAGAVVCGECPAGYAGEGRGPGGCSDVDECALGEHDCTAAQVCSNLKGAFRCDPCPDSMLLRDGACVARWTQMVATSRDDHARAIAVDGHDDVLIAGSTAGVLEAGAAAGGQDAFVVKFDSAGRRVFVRQFGTDADEVVTDVVVDADGNAYVYGTTEGRFAGNDHAGGFDLFIARLDADGEVQWIRQFGSAADDSSGGAGFASGALYVTGFTEDALAGSGNAGEADGFVARYTPDGSRVWLRQFGGAGSDLGTALAIDLSGNVFVAGESFGVVDDELRNLGASDLMVIKYDADGAYQWAAQAGTIGVDSAVSVASVEAGNAYVVGATAALLDGATMSAGQDDAFVIKWDASGSTHWTRQFGSSGDDLASAVAVDNFGGAWVTGVARGKLAADAGGAGLFLTKYDSAGMRRWSRQPAGMGAAAATDVAIDGTGNAYVVGFSADDVDGHASSGGVDAFVLKFDAQGERL